MPEEPQATPSMMSAAQAKLQELSRMIRARHGLDAGAQRQFADLVDEISRVIGRSEAPSAETTHLVDSLSHLLETLHHSRERGLVQAARERLAEAALRAETTAPLTTRLVEQLMATLANLGI
jgi:hypothetical protein